MRSVLVDSRSATLEAKSKEKPKERLAAARLEAKTEKKRKTMKSFKSFQSFKTLKS